MKKNVTIGEKIKALRLKHEFTQDELASKAGVTLDFIGKLERGDDRYKNPKLNTIIDLSKALEVSVSDLLENSFEHDSDIALLDKKLSNVTPYKLNEIPLLSGTVSAGAFTSSLNDWAGERIAMPVEKPANKVGWRISGHSMSPDYNDGDIAVIAHGVRFSDGDDIVAENHKGVTIKRLKYLKDGSIELRPLNPDYPTLTFKKGDDLEILGVVVGLYRKMKK